MKFSHSIQFNAVPDWSSSYIAYSNLKKIIYQLEKQINQQNAGPKTDGETDGECSPLLTQSGAWDNPDKVFTRKLDEELEKIGSFYQLKELEIFGEVDALLKDVDEFEAEHAAGEGEGEGMGLRRQSVWARARQQSIFKNFKRRRTSTLGTSDRERGIPEQYESEEEDEEGGAHATSPLNR
jgi:phosphate transporter